MCYRDPALEFINARESVTTLVSQPYGFNAMPDFVPTNGILSIANLSVDPMGRTFSPYNVPFQAAPDGTNTWLWIQSDQRYQCRKLHTFSVTVRIALFLLSS